MTTPHDKAARQRSPGRVRRPEPVMDVLLAVGELGLGLVLPLVKGSDPLAVVVIFLVGTALPIASYLLPPRPRSTLLVIITFGGTFALAWFVSDTYLLYAWFMSLPLGAIVLLRLVYRRQQRGAS